MSSFRCFRYVWNFAPVPGLLWQAKTGKEREPPHDPKGKDDDTESERMQMETRGI